MATKTYTCKDCGREIVLDALAPAPECCGQTMDQVPLDPCATPSAMEARRANVIDDACDDGVH